MFMVCCSFGAEWCLLQKFSAGVVVLSNFLVAFCHAITSYMIATHQSFKSFIITIAITVI